MSINVRKLVVYGGTVLVSLALIALSILVSSFQVGKRGFFPHRGFGQFPLLGGTFVFGRHLPGWLGVLAVIGAYLFLYLSGVVILFLIPRQIGAMRNAFLPADGRRAWRNWLFFLGAGVLTLLALSLLSGLGLITAAAFPLPLFMLALLLLVIWVGLITFGLVIGTGLNRLAGAQHARPLGELALGLMVVFALGRLPYAGWPITLLMAALALGAVVATRLGYGGNWTLSELEHTWERPAGNSSTQETGLEKEPVPSSTGNLEDTSN